MTAKDIAKEADELPWVEQLFWSLWYCQTFYAYLYGTFAGSTGHVYRSLKKEKEKEKSIINALKLTWIKKITSCKWKQTACQVYENMDDIDTYGQSS